MTMKRVDEAPEAAAPPVEHAAEEPQYFTPAPVTEQPLAVAPTPSDDFTYTPPADEEDEAAAAEAMMQQYVSQASPAGEATGEAGNHEAVSGRVVLVIAPVPDFDRLLSIDGALGRMTDVRNVSLVDYAREQVTFRIEVDRPTSAEDFARDLSEASSMDIGVVSSTPGNLSLRLS